MGAGMPRIFQGIIRKATRGAGEQTGIKGVSALFVAGSRLLAQYDCHDRRVSVVRLAEEAEVSLGTFYARFSSKDGFIAALTDVTFRAASNGVSNALSDERLGEASAEEVVRAIVRNVVRDIGEPKTAGILRAALKLGPAVPEMLEPMRHYRALATKRAQALLTRKKKVTASRGRIDAAMQILFGTVIGTVIEGNGPLRSGSSGMADSLADMLVGFLGIKGNSEWSPATVEERPSSAKRNKDIEKDSGADGSAPELPEGYVPIVDPDLGKVTGAIKMRPKRRHGRLAEKPVKDTRRTPLVSPSNFRPAPNPETRSGDLSARKRKRHLVV